MRFHHVGILVNDIESHFDKHFVRELGIESLTGPVLDPNQQAFTAMISTGPGAGIELISPSEDDSPLKISLDKGGGLHHICYEVNDITESFSALRDTGMVPVSAPQPATLFEGLKVAFLYSRLGGLLELVESPVKDQAR